MADRWGKADCLRDVFELLAREIPLVDRPNKPPTRLSDKTVADIQAHLPQVRTLVVHRPVLRMIEEMISEDFPRSSSPVQFGRPSSVAGILCPSTEAATQPNTHMTPSIANFQLPFSIQQSFDYGNANADIQNVDVDGLLSFPGVFDFDSWM